MGNSSFIISERFLSEKKPDFRLLTIDEVEKNDAPVFL